MQNWIFLFEKEIEKPNLSVNSYFKGTFKKKKYEICVLCASKRYTLFDIIWHYDT